MLRATTESVYATQRPLQAIRRILYKLLPMHSRCWACPDRVLYDAALNEEGSIARLNHNGRFLHSNYTILNSHSCPKLDNRAQGGYLGGTTRGFTSGLECALHERQSVLGQQNSNPTTPLPKSTSQHPPRRLCTPSEYRFDKLQGRWSRTLHRMRLYKLP